MAKCKWCDRSGLFFKVNEKGLCSTCQPLISMDVTQRFEIIDDSIKIINESKHLDTRLYRLEMLIDHLKSLCRYEQKGISITSPPPSVIINKYIGMKDTVIKDTLKQEVDDAVKKSAIGSTLASKVNPLNKILLKIYDYKNKIQDRNILNSLEKHVAELTQKIQLDNYINLAKKAEFKKQNKKALDQYYEALYFLKHDEIEDSHQKDLIENIEKNIIRLGGALN